MDLQPAASVPRPEPSYRIAGEPAETFTRAQVRDRIRTGAVTPDTEVTLAEHDDYRPASSFPELARYFTLLAAGAAASQAAVVPPSARRVLAGLAYPLTGIGWIVLVIATLLQSVPFGSIIAGVFTGVYALAIIRTSSEGSITMPPLRELGSGSQFALSFLKIIGVTIGSAVPLFLGFLLMAMIPSVIFPLAATCFGILYYAAAMAALAKWNNLRIALTPSIVVRTMTILGLDFVIAIVMMFVALGMALGASTVFALFVRAAPVAVDAVVTLLTLFAMFYAYHLIGWGMYRHRDEL